MRTSIYLRYIILYWIDKISDSNEINISIDSSYDTIYWISYSSIDFIISSSDYHFDTDELVWIFVNHIPDLSIHNSYIPIFDTSEDFVSTSMILSKTIIMNDSIISIRTNPSDIHILIISNPWNYNSRILSFTFQLKKLSYRD
jgi:hypothetical protein